MEVGNAEQDKFIFDLGTGAYINLWATGVPFAKLNKVCWSIALQRSAAHGNYKAQLSPCAAHVTCTTHGCQVELKDESGW